MTNTLTGPMKAPDAANPDALIVFLHGYGANGQDLFGMEPHFRRAAPTALIAAPNAPLDLPGAAGGKMWFPITRIDPNEMARGCAEASPAIHSYLDMLLHDHAIKPSRLILIGFSQGCMLTLHVGPRRADRPAGLIGFSGVLCDGERLLTEARHRPPVLLVHGQEDNVVPVGALYQSMQGLAAAGFFPLASIEPGLPHGIGNHGLQLALEFVHKQLSMTPP
jgi:phospholipase/carboxylesterase